MESSSEDPLPKLYFLLEILSPQVVFYSLSGFSFLLLLGISAFVLRSKVILFSLTPEDLTHCKAGSSSSEKRVVQLMKNPKKLLASLFVINSAINVGIVTICTTIASKILEPSNWGTGFVLGLIIVISLFLFLFAELVSRNFTEKNSLASSKAYAVWLNFLIVIFNPFIWLFYSGSGNTKSEEETSKRIEKSSTEAANEQNGVGEEKSILKGIAKFGTLSVTQVMRSRIDIVGFDIEENFHELMDKINKNGYSRMPIYKDTIDNIEGILYIKDILPHIEESQDFKWQELLVPGFFIPQNKKIDSLLKDFQEKHVHLAIVVDEYGGTSGLITLEDIIEEVVGEINDEFDDEDITYNKIDNNTFVFEGKTSLNDFCKVIGMETRVFDEARGTSESLAGLLLEINAKLPLSGEKIYFKYFTFTVASVDKRRIKRVRVSIKRPDTELHFTD